MRGFSRDVCRWSENRACIPSHTPGYVWLQKCQIKSTNALYIIIRQQFGWNCAEDEGRMCDLGARVRTVVDMVRILHKPTENSQAYSLPKSDRLQSVHLCLYKPARALPSSSPAENCDSAQRLLFEDNFTIQYHQPPHIYNNTLYTTHTYHYHHQRCLLQQHTPRKPSSRPLATHHTCSPPATQIAAASI
jgi:hypothetical protein